MRFRIPKPVFYASAIATSVAGCYLIKDYLSGGPYEIKEKLTDKVFIVTGANSGIGLETTRALAKQDAKVIMACRDMAKCETVRYDIVLETRNKYVYCRKCDLSSQESIRKFVERFKQEHSRLDVLINNAGVMRCPQKKTKEGIEMQLGVNHMGHFLLTNLLLDVLKASAPSRIIVLSSRAHTKGKINVQDLNSTKKYNAGDAYAQSKLANVLFTYELAKKLKGTNVTVNAVHPGLVNTEIGRHLPIFNNIIGRTLFKPLAWIMFKTPIQGAQCVLRAALDPSLKDVTGTYFSVSEVSEPMKDATDPLLAQWLWKVSEKWTKLNVTELGSS